VTESAGLPVADDVEALADFQADAVAASGCVVCGSPSTTQLTDPPPITSSANEAGPLPTKLPMLHLCDEHWSAYHTDWLLIGWCVDHYAEALRYCEVHEQHVPPL